MVVAWEGATESLEFRNLEKENVVIPDMCLISKGMSYIRV
jgi:hypothetical protein